MTLREESSQRSSQAIVVELLDRDVPEDIRSTVGGPGADVLQRHGVIEPRRNEQTQHAAMIELGLRIGGKVLIDNLRDLHPFQQRPEHRQRAEVAALGQRLVSIPRDGHVRNIRPLNRISSWKGRSP